MTDREKLLAIFKAGLAAAQPDEALLRHLKLEPGKLIADGKEYDLAKGRILVIGAGKGAAPMAKAIESMFGDKIAQGAVVVKYDHGLPMERIKIREAAHPEPDAAGQKAAAEILALAREARPDDLVICLLTGGASALLPAPAHGLSLADLRETTSLLLASGAAIHEINAIRKHLSELAGGQLARAVGGARILSVIVSDVIGDDLEAIASGPTAPDTSTYQDCLAIIKKYGLADKLPPKALEILKSGAEGQLPETPKPGDPAFAKVQNILVATNSQALSACASEAEKLGMRSEIFAQPLMGEASEAASALAARAKEIAANLKAGEKPVCLLAGGETTVVIKGRGKGGRNQEMALAASIDLVKEPRILGLFAGTDGTDGPTDAAGGFADSETVARIGGMERAQAMLADNDSNRALVAAGALLITGPTRTNVMDLAILLIKPE